LAEAPKKEKTAIFRAAAEAQRVAVYILGLDPDYAAAHTLTGSDDDDNVVEDPTDDTLA